MKILLLYTGRQNQTPCCVTQAQNSTPYLAEYLCRIFCSGTQTKKIFNTLFLHHTNFIIHFNCRKWSKLGIPPSLESQEFTSKEKSELCFKDPLIWLLKVTPFTPTFRRALSHLQNVFCLSIGFSGSPRIIQYCIFSGVILGAVIPRKGSNSALSFTVNHEVSTVHLSADSKNLFKWFWIVLLLLWAKVTKRAVETQCSFGSETRRYSLSEVKTLHYYASENQRWHSAQNR